MNAARAAAGQVLLDALQVFVVGEVGVEAREIEPMMKAARRKNLTSSSLTFLRQKASAIKAALYDRSDRSRAQRSAGTAFLIRAASGALGLPFQVLAPSQ